LTAKPASSGTAKAGVSSLDKRKVSAPSRGEWVWKRLPKLSGEVEIASLIALNEFTPENGDTLIVPGSHRWEEGRYPEPHEAVAAGIPAGSAVVYLGSTLHGGGSNGSDAIIRRGIHVSYALGWLRTEENNGLSIPPEVARGLSPRASALLGLGIHATRQSAAVTSA